VLNDGARFCGGCGKAAVSTETAARAGAPPSPPSLVGRDIAGRYRVLAKLGEGGMGAVYRAEQISLKRVVALKVLRPELSADPQLLRRFNAEAELVGRLHHPNTVSTYDFGTDADGSLFIAMEFIEGRSLRQALVAEAPFPLGRALAIAAQVAASIAEAHAFNIVHRDLKPDNVMLQERGRSRDVVRVLDFGIAKLRDDTRGTQMALTQAGDMLGTPQYMSPEQIRGEPIDGRTDVYSLGCILYEMLTARMPFEGATVMAILSKHLLDFPVPPSQRRPELGLTPAIDTLVMSALVKERDGRPTTMEVFGEQLGALLAAIPGAVNSSVALNLIGGGSPSVATPAVAPAVTGHGATVAVAAPLGTAPIPGAAAPASVPFAPAPALMPGGAPLIPGGEPLASPPRSRRGLFVALGLIAAIGAGVGGWAATRGGGGASVGGDPKAAVDPKAPTVTPPPLVTVPPLVTPPPVTPPPATPPAKDPWASDAPVTPTGPTGPTAPSLPPPPPPPPTGGVAAPLPGELVSAKTFDVRMPPGFVSTRMPDGSIQAQNGKDFVLIVTPVTTTDIDELIRLNEQTTGFTFQAQEQQVIQGASRPMIMFTRTERGVAYAEFAVLFLDRTPPLAAVVVAPVGKLAPSETQAEVQRFFAERIHLK
jgi:hypothetical protein